MNLRNFWYMAHHKKVIQYSVYRRQKFREIISITAITNGFWRARKWNTLFLELFLQQNIQQRNFRYANIILKIFQMFWNLLLNVQNRVKFFNLFYSIKNTDTITWWLQYLLAMQLIFTQ